MFSSRIGNPAKFTVIFIKVNSYHNKKIAGYDKMFRDFRNSSKEIYPLSVSGMQKDHWLC